MKIRALVFDDEKILRELISSVLKRREYEVHDFSEPGLCPLSFDRECPCPVGYTCADIIITDLNMPNITGLEFIENQIKHGCKVRNIALISGDWSEPEMKRAHELGCLTFSKPLRIAELIDWLNECEKRIDPNRKLWDCLADKAER
jgi:CheY-like chemotaxis protein